MDIFSICTHRTPLRGWRLENMATVNIFRHCLPYFLFWMRILRRIYSTYSLFLFAAIFLIFLPAFLILIYTNRRHPLVFLLHRYWAWLYFSLSFIPVKLVYSKNFDPKKQYIFCANHFSFLDIPAMGINRIRPIFVGKHTLGKIPLFGFVYRKIHITLDRENLKSRYAALELGANELDKGQNLVIFPEGGMKSKNPPLMARFKDGAFRLSIEKQVPIVPVTLPWNWTILPDDGKLLLHWRKNMVIFHDPIDPTGLSPENIDDLKRQIFAVIDKELRARNDIIDAP
jgi:1-acyl-sn-glycerol-3-phosphate acyltransferase